MRDLLVRYLLGELDDDEQRELEERLRRSPELRQELAYLQRCFSATEETPQDTSQPPRGLAERVTGQVCGDDYVPDNVVSEDAYRAPSGQPAAAEPPSGTLGWNFTDLVVAAGVVLAVAMLLFPAMQQSREAARRRVCQNNMGQVGMLLSLYAQTNNGRLPQVRPQDNAGIFAVRLVDGGYVNAQQLAQLLICPASPLAKEVAAQRVVVRIPTLDQLEVASDGQLSDARRLMGGTYAYRIGFVQGGWYHHAPYTHDSLSPMLADAPAFNANGLKIANHGGYGQNVLYQDQSVRYQHDWNVPGRDDHLFLNAVGVPAAGRGPRDVVLGRSEATPGLMPVVNFSSSEPVEPTPPSW